MAIRPEKREDLLNEATQYDIRLEFCLTSAGVDCDAPVEPRRVFIGMRSTGGWSVFFGEDPVLHFNSSGQLRRLYCDGRKYSASQGHLMELTRGNEGPRVNMLQKRLAPEIEHALLEKCLLLLQDCLSQMDKQLVHVVGQYSKENDPNEPCSSEQFPTEPCPPEQSEIMAAAQLRMRLVTQELRVAPAPNA